MSTEYLGFAVMIAVFVLMFSRVPICISMGIPAIIGILILRSTGAVAGVVNTMIWEHSFSYTLSTIPMFVLMGEILFVANISRGLFDTFNNWFGRVRGGLAIATIGASAAFAAACGSSLATTGTMGVISSKEMLNAGYDKKLCGGAIVAGGTLGILIPPSTTFILYGMLAEQSIGKLLIAGILPGLLLTSLYMLTIAVIVRIKPNYAPITGGCSWETKFKSLSGMLPIIILFVVVIGGIYMGLFSATEAGGVGAIGALLIAVFMQQMDKKRLAHALVSTLRTTGFIFAIITAAYILNYLLVITQVPNILANFLAGTNLSKTAIFFLLVLMYLILGAIMDTLAMIVVTMPIVLPVIQLLGFDLIWFGVIIILIYEMALISPPIGMNCFVLNGVVKELDLTVIFKGAIYFILPILVCIVILYIFPQIALFLPNRMF